jgi:hypothetical protein
MNVHKLKTDPVVFEQVHCGVKTFEIRFDDRHYEVGDILILQKTAYSSADMKAGAPLQYTGGEIARQVTHLMRGPVYGLAEGWVIMSIRSI